MKSAALRRFYEATGFTVMRAAVLINIAALLGIIGLIVVNAWPAMTWEFLTEPPRDLMTKGGILPCIIGTFCLALGALVIALPLGVASAVYLKEYSRPSGDIDASFDCKSAAFLHRLRSLWPHSRRFRGFGVSLFRAS
ncbi:MAG: hypothetical protein ACLT49_02640 [Sutterella wadsworthensis]